MKNSFNIEQFLDLINYEQSRLDRRKNNKNGKSTQEFFTPYSIVKRMCENINASDWADPDKTFLEPCCGNFQFGCYIIWNRIQHGIDWKTTVNTLYALDLMEDNIQESKERVISLLDQMNIDYDKEELKKIMDKNIVCSDIFRWNFDEWRSYTDEELKILKVFY